MAQKNGKTNPTAQVAPSWWIGLVEGFDFSIREGKGQERVGLGVLAGNRTQRSTGSLLSLAGHHFLDD